MPSYIVDITDGEEEKFLIFMRGILGIEPTLSISKDPKETIPEGILEGVPSAVSTYEEVETGPITQADILEWARDGDVTPKTVRQLLEGGVLPDDIADIIELRSSMTPIEIVGKGKKNTKVLAVASPTIEAMIRAYHQCDDDIDLLGAAVAYTPQLISPDDEVNPGTLNAVLYRAVRDIHRGEV